MWNSRARPESSCAWREARTPNLQGPVPYTIPVTVAIAMFSLINIMCMYRAPVHCIHYTSYMNHMDGRGSGTASVQIVGVPAGTGHAT